MSDLNDPFSKFIEGDEYNLSGLPEIHTQENSDFHESASPIQQFNDARAAYYLKERGVFTRWMLKGRSDIEVDDILDYLTYRGRLFLKLEKKYREVIDKIFSKAYSDDAIKTLVERFIKNKDSKTLNELIFFLVEEFNILNFELMVSKLINDNNYSSKDFGEEFKFLLVDAKPKEERESFLFIQWSTKRDNLILNHLIQKFNFKLDSYFIWLASQELRVDLESHSSVHPFTRDFISPKVLPSPNPLKKSAKDEES